MLRIRCDLKQQDLMSSTGSKLIRSSTMRLLAKFVNMAVGLVMMPLIIRTLGDRHYGIWILVGTYLGFMGLFDLGITQAVSRFLSRALGTDDEDDYRRFFATGIYISSGLGAVLLVLLLILAMCSTFIIRDPADAHLFRWLAVILGVNMAFQFPVRAFRSLLRSHLRYEVESAVDIVVALVRAPLVILVFHLGYRLLGLAFVSAGIELLAAAVTVPLACRVHRDLSFSIRLIDKERAKRLFGYGFYTLLAHIADLLRYQVSPVVITIFASVSLVTPYAIASRLNRIVIEFMIALVNVLSPVFSRQEGRDDLVAMRKTYLFTCRISTYTSVLLGGLMMLLGRTFIERWLGPEYTYVVPIMHVLMIGTIMTCAQMPTVGFLYGTSRNKYYAMTNMIHGILCAGLSSALIVPFGLMGVAIGIAVPTVLIKFFVQPFYACRVLQIPMAQFYLRHALLNFTVPILYLLAFYLITHSLIRAEYIHIFAVAFMGCLFFVPYALFCGLNMAQRQLIFRSIRIGRADYA